MVAQGKGRDFMGIVAIEFRFEMGLPGDALRINMCSSQDASRAVLTFCAKDAE